MVVFGLYFKKKKKKKKKEKKKKKSDGVGWDGCIWVVS